MKTTKKGFTLIELIVVIAIIGVLAAILVPTMLGYVRKSKLSSANSTASSVYKAINSALTELDEEGIDVGGSYLLTYDKSSNSWTDEKAIAMASTENKTKFTTKVANFFADIDKVTEVKSQMCGGSCIAVSVASDSTYTGTYPAGVVTSDNYDDYSGNAETALEDAIKKAGFEGTGTSCKKAEKSSGSGSDATP